MIWTCDPVADAEAYTAEQDERLEQRPVCDECGKHIQDDYCYIIDGRRVCPECIKDYREWID
jgi:formylmethanofuran dehydrogenase subunit E